MAKEDEHRMAPEEPLRSAQSFSGQSFPDEVVRKKKLLARKELLRE